LKPISKSRPKGVHPIVNRYSRQDVIRILDLSPRQLVGWERAELIPVTETYGFQELTQLRVLRGLRGLRMSPKSISNSVQAMKAVSGIGNPLLESTVVQVGSRIAFRHSGMMVDPIRRQFLFDFEAIGSGGGRNSASVAMVPVLRMGNAAAARDRNLQNLFVLAVQAEEQGKKDVAAELYRQILEVDPAYTAALINMGTISYHLKQFAKAEDLYRRATEADDTYVLAFFDLGNVLDELQRPDESIAAYQRAIALAPTYGDAHYNLALAYERKGERRNALRHWQVYARLDKEGTWADHARGQIRKLLSREKLSIAHRSEGFRPHAGRQASRLALVPEATIPA
jgi:hypothetical protein